MDTKKLGNTGTVPEFQQNLPQQAITYDKTI